MKRLLRKLFGIERKTENAAYQQRETPKQQAAKKAMLNARMLFDQGNVAEALQAAQQTAAAGVDLPGLYLLEGLCLQKTGRPDEALAAVRTELVFRPENKEAQSKEQELARLVSPSTTSNAALGDLLKHIQTGDVEAAFVSLNALKAQKKPTPGVDYLRGLYFMRKNQPQAAFEAMKEELRYFPANLDAVWLLRKLEAENPVKATLGDQQFQALFVSIRPYTMVSEARLFSLYNLARDVCERDVPGNFVECGVAAGGSSALLAAVITRHSKRPRLLFSCDTFEGMPEASIEDRHEGKQAEATGWGKGTCSASEKSLLEAASALNASHVIRPVKGLFGATLPKFKEEMGGIAFLHMDGDWYSSTWDILDNLFDQVQPGGRIQIDDYGYWDGCKKAMTDFEKRRALNFKFNIVDESGVWLAK